MSDTKPNFTRVIRKTAPLLDLSVVSTTLAEMVAFTPVRRSESPVVVDLDTHPPGKNPRVMICRIGLLLVTCVAIIPTIHVVGANDPPPVVKVCSLDSPPREIADALRDLTHPDVDRRKAAAAILSRIADAEPYLRHYRGTKEGKSDGFAGDALGTLEEARARRNLEQVAEWAKAGRYDLLVDVSP